MVLRSVRSGWSAGSLPPAEARHRSAASRRSGRRYGEWKVAQTNRSIARSWAPVVGEATEGEARQMKKTPTAHAENEGVTIMCGQRLRSRSFG